MYLAGLLLGFVCVAPCILAYLLFVRGVDRYEPEPLGLLAAAFLWGALGATMTAVVGSSLGAGALQMMLGAPSGDPTVMASTSSIIAPVVEETTKGFGLVVIWLLSSAWLKELDGPLDGVIFGATIGLGFTLSEDVLYLAGAMAENGIEGFGALFVLRTVLSGLGHASFTAVTGLGIGLAVEARSTALKVIFALGGWTLAVMLHSIHNLLVTVFLAEGLGLLVKLLLFWLVDLLFVLLVIALVIRDRSIVARGLADEVGTLLEHRELERTTSWWMLVPLWNFFSLKATPAGYGPSRRKQLALIELAFLKHRRRRGENDLDAVEHRLRSEIGEATRGGVVIA